MSYQALVVNKSDDDFSIGVEARDDSQLPEAEVTIAVDWSDVNYKDALASTAAGRVVTKYPLVLGIDLAGTVQQSSDAGFSAGDKVVAIGYDIGTGHDGGYAELARLPAKWVAKLPDGLSSEEAMAIGTAGFTAAMSVDAIQAGGVAPGDGPIIVPGATGGVGTTGIAMLNKLGYEVVASSGKSDQADFLKSLGANEVLTREDMSAESKRPLESERWAGAIDAVGGSTTANILRSTKHSGVVALSGLTGGFGIETSVMPFILRGVQLVGIDSVWCEMDYRNRIWGRLAGDLKLDNLLDLVTDRIALDGIQPFTERMLGGQVVGRTLVQVSG